MKDFRDRVAVVTGAASGIGRALADRFAAEGMRVVLADIEESALNQAAAAMRAAGATVLPVRTDVSRADDVEALARAAVDAFGGVHVLCNNAGVSNGGFSWELSLGEWKWVLGVNLWGVIHGIRSFVPIMLAQGTDGHIVNTASLAGLTSGPFNAPYGVSKHGVVTLSESLSHELAIAGGRIKVSVLCPGWVNTRIIDASRNRPPGLPAVEIPADDPGALWIRKMIDEGLPPIDVANQVLEAIQEERFCVLTHPEFSPAVRARVDDLLEGRIPTLPALA